MRNGVHKHMKFQLQKNQNTPYTMRDGGMSCDVTINNEWKNSIHKTQNKVTEFSIIKYVHNTTSTCS